MGVVSLLIFFEFIILLLHPLVERIMHHNKVLELLVLVVIGAGLVPLHHKLEHIVLDKLTKAKKIVVTNVENSEKIVIPNDTGENNIKPYVLEEVSPALFVDEEVDINGNSSPALADTEDEQKNLNN
jgi:hypothetical protein